MPERDQQRRLGKVLGPGLLFAGAAVGVSHLVQSTRAGAVYGLGLMGLLIAANIVKYPAFSFGPRYAAATGTSLLEGYRRQGRWALGLYGLLTLLTMFTVEAAVAIVTAALAKVAFGLSLSPLAASAGLLLICMVILAAGRFPGLDAVIKVVIAVLTLSTLLATVLILPRVPWHSLGVFRLGAVSWDDSLLFGAAFVGWMPSAIDVAVWHSLWTLARREQTGHQPTLGEAMLDFNIGYAGTAILAACFVCLGASVMHESGQSFSPSAAGFAAQIITLYTDALGQWSRPLIGVCAFAVMFSTTLTVVDGFPRAIGQWALQWRTSASPSRQTSTSTPGGRIYWIALVVLGVGSWALLRFGLQSLKSMVDLATTLSFLTAPVLAWLNHRAVSGPEVPEVLRPSRGLARYSATCVVLMAAFALIYLRLRFF